MREGEMQKIEKMKKKKDTVEVTASGKVYPFEADDSLLSHMQEGRHIKNTYLNRGFDLFEIYDKDGKTKLAEGKRLAPFTRI